MEKETLVLDAIRYNSVLSMAEKLELIDDLFSINTSAVLFIGELR